MMISIKKNTTEESYTRLLECYLEMNDFQEPQVETKIINETLVKLSDKKDFKKIIKWLGEKRPIQYYVGYTYVFNKKILIDQNVMIPGPEMDIFINTAKKYLGNCNKVMEICTGSGVIPVILGKEFPEKNFYASDISGDALNVAQRNVDLYQLSNVTLLKGCLYEPFELIGEASFDMLISNPPYAKTGMIKDLILQLKDHAPRISIDGGDDGLNFYRLILNKAQKYLNMNGYIIFENGENQSEEVQKLLKEYGFRIVEVVKDRIDIKRFVVAQLISQKCLSKRN